MGGIGGRGPGETKLEEDRRRVKQRISSLERELKSLFRGRRERRKRRAKEALPVISIIGYTNAGKFREFCKGSLCLKARMLACMHQNRTLFRLLGGQSVLGLLCFCLKFLNEFCKRQVNSAWMSESKYFPLLVFRVGGQKVGKTHLARQVVLNLNSYHGIQSQQGEIREVLGIYSFFSIKMGMNAPQPLQAAKPPAVKAYIWYQYTVMITKDDVAYYTFSVYYDPDLSAHRAGDLG